MQIHDNENIGIEQVNTMALKKANLQRVFQLLYWEKELTQQEIKESLQLSSPTINQALQNLRKSGMIENGSEEKSSGGRKARRIAFNYKSAFSVGVEIRRHHIEIVVIQLDGICVANVVKELDFNNNEKYWKKINSYIKELLKETKIDNVLGVGIAFPGEISFGKNIIERATVFNLQNVPLDYIKDCFDFNVYIENGASTAGFGYTWRDKHINDTVYIITTDAGVAGTIILDNQIFRGYGKAGAFGHMTLDPNGKQCFCGNKGCWSTYCSLSNLTDLTKGDLNEFFSKVKEGDKECVLAWDKYLDSFALALKNIILSFDLNVVIGGKLAPYIKEYIDVLKQKILKYSALIANTPQIMTDDFDGNTIAVGAAMIYVSKLISGEIDFEKLITEEY